MKELLQQILGYLPRYVMDFLEVFSGPKTFIEKCDPFGEKALEQSLIFFGITILVAFLIQAPMLTKSDSLYIQFVELIAMEIGLMFLTLIILRFSWFIVGGKAGYRQLLVYTAYFAGPMIVIILSFSIIGDALFSIVDQNAYQFLRNNPTGEEAAAMMDNPGVVLSLFFMGVGWLAALLWFLVAWGAYRKINEVSKLRSAISFVAYNLISTPATIIAAVVVSHIFTASNH